jgi:hypothetical protein
MAVLLHRPFKRIQTCEIPTNPRRFGLVCTYCPSCPFVNWFFTSVVRIFLVSRRVQHFCPGGG